MSNYINQIKEKIKNKIAVQEINIIDNSQAHRNHASFQEGQSHLTLQIKSNFLRKLKRVEAERILLSIIKKDLNVIDKNQCYQKKKQNKYKLPLNIGKGNRLLTQYSKRLFI